MADHIYKTVELTGTSSVGSDDAIKNALSRASKTTRNLRWFQVMEVRGHIENGEVSHWQVILKVSFTLEEE
jgi:flavin-binding protein dodecin